jgi:hypothetical protein
LNASNILYHHIYIFEYNAQMFNRLLIRPIPLGFLIVLAAFAMPQKSATASDVELLMFERAGCYWCREWDKKIGYMYHKSWEGKVAPLRRIDLNAKPASDLQEIPWPRYSPTFVLMANGQEIGRINGYPGEEFFWPRLDQLLEKADIHSPKKM